MNPIKIPSSNIYNIDGTNSLFAVNKIEKAELTFNKFTRSLGNVLEKEYFATYYDEKNSDGVDIVDSQITSVYQDKALNDFEFVYDSGTDLRQYVRLKNKVKLSIGKPMDIEIDSNHNALYYDAVKNQKWVVFYQDNQEQPPKVTKEYQEKRITATKKVIYDANDNSFELDFSTDYGDSRILIYYRNYSVIEENGEQNFNIWETGYLLSETIYVDGKYFGAEDKTHSYGDISSKDTFALPTNSLIQENNPIEGEPLWGDKLLQNVVNRYARGKEVYTIRCSIADYYDTAGYKQITADDDTRYPIVFQKHDIVEPYVFTYRGEVPLSSYSNGMPKRFEVIGVDFVDKGVVWQELTLQEQPYEQFVEVILDPNKSSITLFEGEYYRSLVINGIDGLTDAVNSIVSNENGTLTINYRTNEEVRILVYYTV